MTVHSFHIFDRRGKTLFTKRYLKSKEDGADINTDDDMGNEQLSEQRKLVFGMLFSLRELSTSLSCGDGRPSDLQLVKTGATALYNFETVSGLRFVLYTTADTAVGVVSSASAATGASTSTSAPLSAGAPISGGIGASPGPSGTTIGLMASPASGPAIGGDSNTSGDIVTSTSIIHSGVVTTATASMMTSPAVTATIRAALKHIYEHIWVTAVVRSPMYQPTGPNIRSTNFEAALDAYLKGMPWFR